MPLAQIVSDSDIIERIFERWAASGSTFSAMAASAAAESLAAAYSAETMALRASAAAQLPPACTSPELLVPCSQPNGGGPLPLSRDSLPALGDGQQQSGETISFSAGVATADGAPGAGAAPAAMLPPNAISADEWGWVCHTTRAERLGTFSFKGAQAGVAIASVMVDALAGRSYGDDSARSVKGKRLAVESGVIASAELVLPDVVAYYKGRLPHGTPLTPKVGGGGGGHISNNVAL